ncbi:phage tail assembly chaperone [Serratia liquefaciens]|uniref:Bacteriophage protein n=1 Tax=Serratia liquefaciens TaxID=614 RepID=A0A515CT17_SERLI|nr:hypothetical protein [Serratia liquefaciens]QDL31315.1 hypothetical protein EGO53_05760 [Serratia liquefaciens]
MEFEIKGIKYRSTKLGVFEQLKVSRKLLPVLAGILGELKGGKITIESALPKIAQSVADLQEEDCNAIIHPCLAVVRRENGKGFDAIFSSGQLMFDDIELMTMLQIVARVIGDSLGNFLQELQGSEKETAALE